MAESASTLRYAQTRVFEQSSLSRINLQSKKTAGFKYNGVSYSVCVDKDEFKFNEVTNSDKFDFIEVKANSSEAIDKEDMLSRFKIEFLASDNDSSNTDEVISKLKNNKELLVQVLALASNSRKKQIIDSLCINKKKNKAFNLQFDVLELSNIGGDRVSEILTDEVLIELAIYSPESAIYIIKEFKITTQSKKEIIYEATKELLSRNVSCDNFLSRVDEKLLDSLLAEQDFIDLLTKNITEQGLICLVKISVDPNVWEKLESCVGKDNFSTELALKNTEHKACEICKIINEHRAWEGQSSLSEGFESSLVYLRLIPKAAYHQLVQTCYLVAANQIIKHDNSEFTADEPLLKGLPKNVKHKVIEKLPTITHCSSTNYLRLLKLSDNKEDWKLAPSVDIETVCTNLEASLDSGSERVLADIQNGRLLTESPDLSMVTCPYLKSIIVLLIPNHQERITQLLAKQLEQYLTLSKNAPQPSSIITLKKEFVSQLLKNKTTSAVIKKMAGEDVSSLLALTRDPEHWQSITLLVGTEEVDFISGQEITRVERYIISRYLPQLVTDENLHDICTQLVAENALTICKNISSDTHSQLFEVLKVLPKDVSKSFVIDCIKREIIRQHKEGLKPGEKPVLDTIPETQRKIFIKETMQLEDRSLKDLLIKGENIERLTTSSDIILELLSNCQRHDIKEIIKNISSGKTLSDIYWQALIKSRKFSEYMNQLIKADPITAIKFILQVPDTLRAQIQHPTITVVVKVLATHEKANVTDERQIWEYLQATPQFKSELNELVNSPLCSSYLKLIFTFPPEVHVDINSVCEALISLSKFEKNNQSKQAEIFTAMPRHITALVFSDSRTIDVLASKFCQQTTVFLWNKLSKLPDQNANNLNLFICHLISNENIEVSQIVEMIKAKNINIWSMDHITIFGKSLLERAKFEETKSETETNSTEAEPKSKKTFMGIIVDYLGLPIYPNNEQTPGQHEWLLTNNYTAINDTTAVVGGQKIYLSPMQMIMLVDGDYEVEGENTIVLDNKRIVLDDVEYLQKLIKGEFEAVNDNTIIVGGTKKTINQINSSTVDPLLPQRLLALLPFIMTLDDNNFKLAFALLSIHPLGIQFVVRDNPVGKEQEDLLKSFNNYFKQALTKCIENDPKQASEFIDRLNAQCPNLQIPYFTGIFNTDISDNFKFILFQQACTNVIQRNGDCCQLAKNAHCFMKSGDQLKLREQSETLIKVILANSDASATLGLVQQMDESIKGSTTRALCLNCFLDEKVSLELLNSSLCLLETVSRDSDSLLCVNFLNDDLKVGEHDNPNWLAEVPIEKVVVLHWHFPNELAGFIQKQLNKRLPSTEKAKPKWGLQIVLPSYNATKQKQNLPATINPLSEIEFNAVIPWVIVSSFTNPSAANTYLRTLCLTDQVAVLTHQKWHTNLLKEGTVLALSESTERAKPLEWKRGTLLQLEQLAMLTNQMESKVLEKFAKTIHQPESFLPQIIMSLSETSFNSSVVNHSGVINLIKIVRENNQKCLPIIVALVNCPAFTLTRFIDARAQSKISWEQVLFEAKPQCVIQQFDNGEIPQNQFQKIIKNKALQKKLVSDETISSLAENGPILIRFFNMLPLDDQRTLYHGLSMESKKSLLLWLAKSNKEFTFNKNINLLKLIQNDEEFVSASLAKLLTYKELVPALLDILLKEEDVYGRTNIHEDNKKKFIEWIKLNNQIQLIELIKDEVLPEHVYQLIYEDDSISELVFTSDIIAEIINSDDIGSITLLSKLVNEPQMCMKFRHNVLKACISNLEKFHSLPTAAIKEQPHAKGSLSLHQQLLINLLRHSYSSDLTACLKSDSLETKLSIIELLYELNEAQYLAAIIKESSTSKDENLLLVNDENLSKNVAYIIIKLCELNVVSKDCVSRIFTKSSQQMIAFTEDVELSEILFKSKLFEQLPEEAIINVMSNCLGNLLTLNQGELQEGLLGYLEQPEMYRYITKAAARDIQAHPNFILKLIERANNDDHQKEVFEALKSSVSTEDMFRFCPYCQMELVIPFIIANQQEFVSALIKIEPWSKELLNLIKNEAVFPKLLENLEPNESTFNFLIRLDEVELNEAQEELIKKYFNDYSVGFENYLLQNPVQLKVIMSCKRQYCCVFNIVYYSKNKLTLLHHTFVASSIPELLKQTDLSSVDEDSIESLIASRLQLLLKHATTETVLKALDELKLDDVVKFTETEFCTPEVKHRLISEGYECDCLKNLEKSKERASQLRGLITRNKPFDTKDVYRALSEQGKYIIEIFDEEDEEWKRIGKAMKALTSIVSKLESDKVQQFISSLRDSADQLVKDSSVVSDQLVKDSSVVSDQNKAKLDEVTARFMKLFLQTLS